MQRGRARFELDGEQLDAPAGTFVFVRPGVKRTAFAEEPGTTIIALGGTPGKAYEPTGFEIWAPLGALYQAGEYAEAADRGQELIKAHPEYPMLLYNVACCESLAGRAADAIEHLRLAIERCGSVPLTRRRRLRLRSDSRRPRVQGAHELDSGGRCSPPARARCSTQLRAAAVAGSGRSRFHADRDSARSMWMRRCLQCIDEPIWLDARMEILDLGRLTDAQRGELEGGEDDPFDGAGISLRFRPKDRHVALREASGRLVASAGLTTSEVEVADERIPVVGLGGVFVSAAYRGRGLSRQIVGEALDRAPTMGPSFVILFCHANRVGLYARLGFVGIDHPVSVQQPDGFETMPMRTMWRGLRPDASWPEGPVRVHGLPF